MKILAMALIVAISMLIGCKGKEEAEPVDSKKNEVTSIQENQPETPAPIDHELAEKGEELFKAKGCIACHSIGEGRRTGPDLAGVTERRKLEWIQNMILNPDEMLEKDPVARELLATYMVKMTNQNVAPEQAQAIVMYFRVKDSEEEEEEGEEEKEEVEEESEHD